MQPTPGMAEPAPSQPVEPRAEWRPHPAARNLLSYPCFSLQERERRWDLVRAAMDGDGLDCVVVPGQPRGDATLLAAARYLTHVGGPDADLAVVWPRTGEPTVVSRDAAYWIQAQPWCTDVREPAGSYAATVATRLEELGLEDGRIGLVGLGDPSDDARTTLTYSFWRRLREGLPRARWVECAGAIAELRRVKSAEEVAFLSESTRIVESAYRAVVAVVQPGALDQEIWAAAVEALCGLGSELPAPPRSMAGPSPDAMAPGATPRPVARGWLFRGALEAAWGGYRVRAARPLACGRPDAEYAELMKLTREVWNRVCARVVPGVTVQDLAALAAVAGESEAPRAGPIVGATVSLRLTGCGLGGDVPRFGRVGDPSAEGQRRLRPGWCFGLQVDAMAGVRRLSWGDPVLVTRRGVRRLGDAYPEILVAPA
jgi:Xaa-Pro aminopeptidase